ncbi:hypothetical protein, partial [Actinoplanes sp. NPDC020271]|uniref:hypothetical protein n=1 Tax=Actinoplanes sp. NPDC020271 TaxID=3363896 RepID=UPI003787568B
LCPQRTDDHAVAVLVPAGPEVTSRMAAAVLAHLVFRQLDTEAIDEPDSELKWANQAIEQVRSLVEALLPGVTAVIDDLYTDRAQIRAVCSDVTRVRQVAERVLNPSEAALSSSQDRYRRTAPDRKRRPNAVSILVDRAVLPEGEALTLTTPITTEAEALRDWLAEDPKRRRATWMPHRGKPILWSADGQRYSPSGLISHMWELAGWENRPVANQGTARWRTSSGETLAELAWRVLRDLETAEEE